MAMNVSLWGPHSFETSTFPLAVVELVLGGLASPPLSRMNSYLLHHVGSCELFCAVTVVWRFAKNKLAPINARIPAMIMCFFFMRFPPRVNIRRTFFQSGCVRGFYLNTESPRKSTEPVTILPTGLMPA